MNDCVVESLFEHNGYQCVVVLSILGHRCGYVGIPESHPYFGKNYENLCDIECHGGLTYSRGYLLGSELPNIWWIGFDCAHFDDKPDKEAVSNAFKDHPRIKRYEEMLKVYRWGKVCSQKYVEDQCRHIADQLSKIHKIRINEK